MGRKEQFSPPALGGSSLLVVFAVLALTVFALLSLSTVRADARLGDAATEAVSGYYAADCQAQEILARLRAGERPKNNAVTITPGETEGETVCSYVVPISDAQELQVKLRLRGADYTVLRWSAAPAGEWDYDDGLPVWDGES